MSFSSSCCSLATPPLCTTLGSLEDSSGRVGDAFARGRAFAFKKVTLLYYNFNVLLNKQKQLTTCSI